MVKELASPNHFIFIHDDEDDPDYLNVSLFKILKPFDWEIKKKEWGSVKSAQLILLKLIYEKYVEPMEFYPVFIGPNGITSGERPETIN